MTPEVKNQPAAFWNEVGALFMKRIAPYELQEPKRVFARLMDLADFANPRIPADVGAWCEAIYSQLKRHLHDSPPMFLWVPGKVPPLVSRHQEQLAAQNKRGGSVTDQLDVDSIGKEHAEQQQREQERTRFQEACEKAIADFYPIKYGRLSYAIRSEVQGVLRKYLDEQIAKGEPNMVDVHRKIVAYIDKEYAKLASPEKLGITSTHNAWERR